MSSHILEDIDSKIGALPGSRPDVAKTIASLWDRWYTTMGLRLGVKPETLYKSAGIDIQHASVIAERIGRDIDLPDSIKQNPTLAALLQHEEIVEYLADHLPEPSGALPNTITDWMQANKLVDAEGQPRTFYHGSFHDFSHFDEARQGDFSRLGKGFYFTSDPRDASDNYASPDSPELQAKAQAILDTLKGANFLWQTPPNYTQIKERLSEEGGAVYPVFLRMNRPFVISSEEHYHRGTYDKAIPEGAIISSVILDHNGTMNQAQMLIRQLGGATSTVDAINLITNFAQANDFKGLPLQIVQRAGYDGVVDRSAGQLWHTPDEAEHFIVFEPGQIKSAIGNAGSYNDTSVNILYQQAPEYDKVLYQFAGINAAGRDWTSLNQARGMEERRISMERIRQLTGWFRGVDDKWRFEIDDSQAMLNPNAFVPTTDYFNRVAMREFGATGDFSMLPSREQKVITDNHVPSSIFNGRLSNAVSHALLFSHYPQLADIPTEIQIHPDLQTPKGHLMQGTPPNCQLVVRAANGQQAMQIILHELQHGIQAIEGFAVGGSADNYNQVSPDSKRLKLKQLQDIKLIFDMADQNGLPITEAAELLGTAISPASLHMAKTTSPKQLKNYALQLEFEQRPARTRYLYLAGEYEARQTVNRQSLSSERRKRIPIDAMEKLSGPLEVVYDDGAMNTNKMDYSSSGPLGAVIRNPLDSRFLMLLSDEHNPSTLLHESAHILLDEFVKQATSELAPQCLKDEYRAICGFVGAEPGTPFNEEQNERWAIACEKYFIDLDTESPVPAAMERMKRFMQESYQRGEEIGVELTPEIKGVLDRMFDRDCLHSKLDFDELSEILNQQPPSKGMGLNT